MAAIMTIRNLHKAYETGEVALRGIDLDLEEGEFLTIVGPSGAGKSTLLRCINRLVEPQQGEIVLDGKDILQANTKELRMIRRNIGMIFQEFNLIERLTVLENVMTGRLGYVGTLRSLLKPVRAFAKKDIERAFELLERVDILDHANKRADTLSGGQRQRVGIARSIMQDPKILLVDEPTSSLDPEIGKRIMKLIHSVSKEANVPVLLNIHDVELGKRYADRVIALRKGKLVFNGPPEDLTDSMMDRVFKGLDPDGDNDSEGSEEIA